MRLLLTLVRKDLRILLRNRSVIVLGLVAPLSLSFLLNLVFGGLDDPDAPVTFDLGVADLDDGAAAGGFVGLLGSLEGAGLVELNRYDREADARAAVDDGDIGAAWIVPAGFSAAVASGQTAELVVVGDVDATYTTSFARAVASRYAVEVGTAALAARVAVDTGVASAAEAAAVAETVAGQPPIASLTPIDAGSAALDATTSLTAGLALFFVFFAAGLPLISVIQERDTGTLARLLVAPVSTAAVAAGKAVVALVIGVASLVTLMVASAGLMGADWGPAAGALLLAVTATLAAAGIVSVAGSLARSPEQAGSAQAVVAVVLGIVGGAFVPVPASDSGVLAHLRKLTPHGWFLDGLEALRDDGLASALPAIAVLAAMGVVTGAVGLRLARWVVRP